MPPGGGGGGGGGAGGLGGVAGPAPHPPPPHAHLAHQVAGIAQNGTVYYHQPTAVRKDFDWAGMFGIFISL